MLKFGFQVQDKISGFAGILTARVEYDTGRIQWLVTPQGLTPDGASVSPEWFNEQRLINQEEQKE